MSLFGIVEVVTNTAIAYGASTSIGKSMQVRPQLEAELAPYLKEAQQQLIKMKATFTNLDPHKKSPELKKSLMESVKASEEAMADLQSDKTLDTLTDIVGNHIGDFENVAAFKKALPNMASIKALKKFATTLVDHENYTKLENLLNDINGFAKLSKTNKMALLKSLESKSIIKEIVAENATLDITKIKTNVKKMAQNICKELKLTKEESNQLISLFEDLTNKHLPKLNPLRLTIVEKLPAFIDGEYQRLSKQHPELVVQQVKATKILTQFEQETSKSSKASKTKSTTPVKALAEDDGKPLGKVVRKKNK